MRRYDAGFRDVKAAIDGGAIGEPLLAHAVHRNPSVPDSFVGEKERQSLERPVGVDPAGQPQDVGRSPAR